MKLEIDDVVVAYGRTTVLFGVSLEVPDGQVVCLMGRNGVGKSTLMNAVMGLLPVRSGHVRIDGADITRSSAHSRARAGIGYVPQGHQVFPHLTVKENLHVVVPRGVPVTAVDDALDVFPALVPLLNRPAGLLSGGQAQQLAIGRALATRPRMMLLDEPTEGIQPSIIMEIEDAIGRLYRETGMSILLVEQYVEFALRLAVTYHVMERGQIVHQGLTAEADPADFAELLAV